MKVSVIAAAITTALSATAVTANPAGRMVNHMKRSPAAEHGSPYVLEKRTNNYDNWQLLDLSILGGHDALIDADVVANVLSENDCSANNKVLGLKAEVNLLGVELAKVCACVEVGADHTQACPSCPDNAHRICGGNNCACECDPGFFSHGGSCWPIQQHCPSPNILHLLSDGTSKCECKNDKGFISDGNAGCINVCLNLNL